MPLATEADDSCHAEIFKSWRSFSENFTDATRMHVVTYCDSPEFVLKLFDELDDLEVLEVVVGDVDDYRERLIDKPKTADRLERLRCEGRLVIYLCETKEVHSKLYLIEYEAKPDTTVSAADESVSLADYGDSSSNDKPADSEVRVRIIVGSPNLSKNAWSNQTNMGVVYDTAKGSTLHTEFMGLYEEHRAYNNKGPFLEDLTERIELSGDDREKVINLYTEGKVGTTDELGEIHGKLADHIDSEVETVNLVLDDGSEAELPEDGSAVDADADSDSEEESDSPISDAPKAQINLSLRGYDATTVDTVSKMKDFDATVSNDTLNLTPSAFHRYTKEVFSVPTMKLNDAEDRLKFHHDGQVYSMTSPPPADTTLINDALADMEAYFETVDNHGNSNNPTAVKAHMMEALLWFFWAPFANRQARFYRSHDVDLDKALPYLYVYGESNGGKGTFTEFALGMISAGRVESAVDADEIGKRNVRNMRSAHTTFPVVVDDITKQKVHSLDTLRNFWKGWTDESPYPMFAFISNDKRPNQWFRNRAKILHFDVNFQTSRRGEAQVNELISKHNPLFSWFGCEYLAHDLRLAEDDDTLAEVRETMLALYDRAERNPPEYFPHEPAERIHDTGRSRWHDLLERDDVELSEEKDTLVISFDESMSYEIHTYKRDPPMTVRVEKRGLDLVIKTPDEFYEWLGEDTATVARPGFLSRLRSRFSG
ncbi:tyrosyl-DNA phosphodiesterase [Halogeometricum luteum]|uniref:Tyrosyl-DNA phosphodiesterase n=1 Tax=Halogeometricum luteum TaxID=2950537 RepID=A0ABU2G8J6_9EURY|nr:tyrosyl-DNA phosphodiesterase [Halogeometricum sp. S3BR5-2]MDS0296514.1 tyrosyl-DNA phosphodiesterase [Halogeometricum sp. S3BR5-2]